jgi:hypothetical protein
MHLTTIFLCGRLKKIIHFYTSLHFIFKNFPPILFSRSDFSKPTLSALIALICYIAHTLRGSTHRKPSTMNN